MRRIGKKRGQSGFSDAPVTALDFCLLPLNRPRRLAIRLINHPVYPLRLKIRGQIEFHAALTYSHSIVPGGLLVTS